MRASTSIFIAVGLAFTLAACGPSTQRQGTSSRTASSVKPPATPAEVERYGKVCEAFRSQKKIEDYILGLIHCKQVRNSAIATDDQRFNANLTMCKSTRTSQKKDPEKTLISCYAAVKLRPEDPQVYRERGLAFGRSKLFAESERDLSKAIALGLDDDPQVYAGRAVARASQNRTDEAIVDILAARRVVKASHGDLGVRLYAIQANMHAKEGEIADAEAAIASGRKIDPDFAAFYRIEGLIALERKDIDGALVAAQTAIKKNPTASSAYALRALVYSQQGKFEPMARDFRLASSYDRRWKAMAERVKAADRIFEISKEALRVLGHDPGAKGPQLTPKAREAMRAFQKSMDLDVDGKFNNPSLTAVLNSANAASKPEAQDPLDVIKRLMTDPGAEAT